MKIHQVSLLAALVTIVLVPSGYGSECAWPPCLTTSTTALPVTTSVYTSTVVSTTSTKVTSVVTTAFSTTGTTSVMIESTTLTSTTVFPVTNGTSTVPYTTTPKPGLFLSAGVITGIVLGVVISVVLLCVGIAFLWKRFRRVVLVGRRGGCGEPDNSSVTIDLESVTSESVFDRGWPSLAACFWTPPRSFELDLSDEETTTV